MTQPRRTLLDVLKAAQAVGTIGRRPIDEVVEHARHFVRALPPGARHVIDLGSGAGLPGLVIAQECPEVSVTMVDRRANRMDALTRAVESMGLSGRVQVITADAEQLGRMPEHQGQFDVVVCRGLGSPAYTARLARPFLAPGGLLIVSEPPNSDLSRWATPELSGSGFGPATQHGAVAVLAAVDEKP